jgi:hypothetical protein
VEEENMTASDPVFKPVTLPDFQNGNDIEEFTRHPPLGWRNLFCTL